MEIYQPDDDSYFLSEVLRKELSKKEKSSKIIEIGIGSGIQLNTLREMGFFDIQGVDINSNSVRHCKQIGLKCKRSHLFDKITNTHKFDIIVFNPPYLPEDKYDKLPDTSGGKKGHETINEFLKQAKNHLNKKGEIFLLTSSLTPNFRYEGYKRRIIARKKIFFEELYIWELSLT